MEPLKAMEPVEANRWWPESLGDSPNAAGSQNEMRYAYFADKNRLAIDRGDGVSVYDTKGHQVSSVQQDQSGGGRRLVFADGRNKVNVDDLSKVNE